MKKSDKFKIGISGHRSVKHEKKDVYIFQLQKLLKYFVDKYPKKEILAVSPLADGADRLFIQAAIKIGLRYEVILPMKPNLYQQDFNENSYTEFNKMLLNARKYKVIPLYNQLAQDDFAYNRDKRNIQYREVGRQLIAETDFMFFLWDGEKSTKIGGTFDTLVYAKEHGIEYKIIYCERENNV